MSDNRVSIDGVKVPRFLYGTAWKEADTRRLTALAFQQGFRGVDTANQPRHYDEAGVGQAIHEVLARELFAREELFLQTKFTFRPGQDHRLPYEPQAPIPCQVEQSFASSLKHLGAEVIDSYLLHGPTNRNGWVTADVEAWRAMEAINDSGRARLLGVSNVTLDQLKLLHGQARITPRLVQNRCYASRGWDRGVREFCRDKGMIYQGFSLLTANRETLGHPEMGRLARRHQKTVSQIVFRFALDAGIIPLTSTTSRVHMQADLDVFKFSLSPGEVARIEGLALR